ncbi:hypothetical protein ACLB2K_040205 [Fragaria x ananassa]
MSVQVVQRLLQASSLLNELLARKLAVDFALSHGFFSVWVETNAREVCRQLSEDSMPNTSVLGRLFEDVWVRMKEDGVWHVNYGSHKANIVAHILAAHACSLPQAEFYFSVPSFMQAAVAAELCNS